MESDIQDSPGCVLPLDTPASDLNDTLLSVDWIWAERILQNTSAASSPVSCIETLVVPVLDEIGRAGSRGITGLPLVLPTE